MGPTGSLGFDLSHAVAVGDELDACALVTIDEMPALSPLDVEAIAPPAVRRDGRSVLSIADAGHALDQIAVTATCGVLEVDGRRRFRRRSTHFDTPDSAFYRAALQRRPDRAQVRIREYPDTGRAFVEVVARDRRGRRRTQRIEIESPQDQLDVDARRFVDTVLADIGVARRLRPSARTSSIRSKIVDRADGSRAAIGVDFRCVEIRPGRSERTTTLDGVVVETSIGSRRSPIEEHLRRRGVRPARATRNAGVSLELRFERG